jgi:hypothetical protein
MNPKIIVADNFFPANQVESIYSDLMEKAQFKDELLPDEGVTYPTICKEFQPENAGKLLALAHNSQKPATINLSCYRLGLCGELDDSFCHADGIYSKWAAVVYLTKGTRYGGTAFWTHVPTGLDEVPDKDLISVAGFDSRSWHSFLDSECKNPQRWQLAGFSGMKFNRLVTYPTSMFHSRYPNNITEPFGSTKQDGRLVWVAFYDL